MSKINVLKPAGLDAVTVYVSPPLNTRVGIVTRALVLTPCMYSRSIFALVVFASVVSNRVVRSTAYTDFYNNKFFCVICAVIESILRSQNSPSASPYKAVYLQPTDYARKFPNT